MVLVGLAEADAPPRVAEHGVERRARVHHGAPVLEQHLAGEDAGRRTLRGRALERRGEPRFRDRVVVEQQDPVGAALECPADARVRAGSEAPILVQPHELDVWKAALDLPVGTVGRAVVDADRLDPLERSERARRVLAAVPVEDDRDEPHRKVRAFVQALRRPTGRHEARTST